MRLSQVRVAFLHCIIDWFRRSPRPERKYPFSSCCSPSDNRNAVHKNQIRVHANEVVAPVSVTDKTGEAVLDLSQKDFHVFDDGVEQAIVHWDLGGDPLAVALVIETSSHIRMMAPVIHSIGNIFTETVMALDGEAAVIASDETVNVPQTFTQDHGAVEKGISSP
jgi:VWFA-related protein